MTLRNAFEDLATEATLAALEAKTPALQSGRVPVDIGSATVSIGASVEVSNDAGNPLPISDAGGSITIDAVSLPLPAGAATSAKQDTLIAAVDGVEGVLGTIDADTSALAGTVAGGAVTVADGGGSLTIDATSLPLPTGAATSAAQSTGNASLSSIDGKTPALASGRVPVDGSGVTQPVSAASLPLPTGAATAANQATIIGHVDGIEGILTTIDADTGSIDGKLPTLQSGAVPVGDNGASLTVDGRSGSPLVVFTRPADTTPYGSADVIGSASTANHEATNAGANGSLIQIISASLMVNLTSVPSGMTTFRLHIWDSQPTAIADNAVFSAAAADRAKYCGWIDLAQISAVGGGFLFTFGDYVGRPIRLSGTSFWFNLAMTGAAGHNPASGTEYRVRFHCAEVGS